MTYLCSHGEDAAESGKEILENIKAVKGQRFYIMLKTMANMHTLVATASRDRSSAALAVMVYDELLADLEDLLKITAEEIVELRKAYVAMHTVPASYKAKKS